jgi:hypothetical protein
MLLWRHHRVRSPPVFSLGTSLTDHQYSRQMDQTVQVDRFGIRSTLHDGHWFDDLLQTTRSRT